MSRADLGARQIGALFVAFSALVFFTIVVLMERACAAPPAAYRIPLFAQCGLEGLTPEPGAEKLALRETREGRSAAFQSWAASARPVTPARLAFGPRLDAFPAALSAGVDRKARYCPSGARI
ncbi:hypothetical protein FM996_00225 [Methylosinus sporium]|uniref:Uncharacterized protein n=1 Tax=Methylosinus sporium TaxID=428 RepID=A0A549T984_METSR|nr:MULTISPECIES: hypothetical protein [Methylosinus]MBU3890893.1 hypothetical protein [Methylosinus sp. KRF6]TRL38427.1 hypothetical protein FM996_00225 [Methylosinus sporium]